MSFLNPFFLWALPAVSVPVLLHLLNKRPPKKMPFAYIAWLREAHKTVMPKKRLREILLMIVRTLVILFLVFFFARPIVHTGGFASGQNSDESMTILLDTSASMGAINGGRESLELMKDNLLEALRKIPISSKIGVVVYSDQIESELAPTDERSRVISALQNAKATFRGTDISAALALGKNMLANQAAGRKTLVIASDMARHGWVSLLSKPLENEKNLQMHVVLWDGVGKITNAGISEATLSLSEEGLLKGNARLHVDNDASAWKLNLNERVVAQGRSDRELAFKAQLPRGGFYSGKLELNPDAASFDDTYYLASRVPSGFRLLIIDGESGFAPADSETYYLRSALESPRDPRIELINVVRPEALSGISFNSYDAVVLANTPGLDEGGLKDSELMSWVERGGGLFITAGSRWPKPPLVPLRFFRSHQVKTETQPFSDPDIKDPFFANISGLGDFEWNQISVTQYVELEKETAATALLSLKNGDPLLVRKQVGKGYVVCLASTLDRAWTNFPAKPVFAPLTREIIASLADPLHEQTTLQATVGSPVRFNILPSIKSVSVVAPNGVASGANIRDGIMEWPAPTIPGLYQVLTDKKETNFNFAVNIPHLDEEGDLSKLSEKDAKRLFPDTPLSYVSGGDNKSRTLLNALQGRDMTNGFLAGLFLLFGLETILGWKKR